MLGPALLLILFAQSSSDAGEVCGDLAAAVIDAVGGRNCSAVEAIRDCLDRRLSLEPAATDESTEDGGPGLGPEAQAKARELQPRTELRQALDQERATAERLSTVCTEAARRTIEERAAANAEVLRARANAEAAEFSRAHPEVPIQAISAVLCRTETYRKWVLAQLKQARRAGPRIDLANLAARRDLQQLARFLDGREHAARRALKERFQGRPLSCGDRVVKLLSGCADTPTLVDDEDDEYVKDPEQPCGYESADLERYTAGGWYLGVDWFQPTRLGSLKNVNRSLGSGL